MKKNLCNENIEIDEKLLATKKMLIADKFKSILEIMEIDIENDHNSTDTPHRISKMLIDEVFSGRFQPKPKITTFPNAKNYDQLYITGPIAIRSTCAHHWQPFIGNCFIGVFPGDTVIGLSKYNRIVNWIASRPQIQEELTEQIADEIEDITGAKGVAVVIKAEHFCMKMRGVKEHQSDFTTSVMRGTLRNSAEQRNEFLTLLNGMKGYRE